MERDDPAGVQLGEQWGLVFSPSLLREGRAERSVVLGLGFLWSGSVSEGSLFWCQL